MGLVSRVSDDPSPAVADELAAHDAETLETVKERLRDDAPESDQQRRETAAFGRLVARRDGGSTRRRRRRSVTPAAERLGRGRFSFVDKTKTKTHGRVSYGHERRGV